MNKKTILILIALLGIVLVGIVGYFQVLKPQVENRTVEVATAMPIANNEVPLAFSYTSGVDALAMVEPPVSSTSPNGLKKVYLLFDNQAYVEYSSDGSDVSLPPAISIFAVSYASSTTVAPIEGADRLTKLRTWAQQNPQFSAWTIKSSEVEEVEVDGASAIRYQASGTYEQEVYVVFYQDNIYVFAGQFEQDSDLIRTSFQELINSVIFE